MLRRLLAITLLIAFGSPLVLPLFAATSDQQTSLPACCRRHGAHRCTLPAPESSSSPSFKAPPCPLYSTALPPLRIATASLNTPLRLSVEQLRDPAPLVPNPRRGQARIPSSNLKRGPPTLLA
jgi:hypothetical protein